MRQLLSMLCICTMLFLLAGCGAVKTPDAAVSRFCDRMNAFDPAGMADCVEGLEPQDIDFENSGFPKELTDTLKENAAAISYTIRETKTDANTAVVAVDFVCPDLSAAVMTAMQEYLAKAVGLAASGAGEEELTALFQEILIETIGETAPEKAEISVEFDCIVVKDQWKLADVPKEISNIMLSNMLSMTDSFAGSDPAEEP